MFYVFVVISVILPGSYPVARNSPGGQQEEHPGKDEDRPPRFKKTSKQNRVNKCFE